MKQTSEETAVIITTAGGAAGKARPRRLTSTLLWAGQILLAAVFVVAAVPKLTGRPAMVQEFGLIGAGQWLRYFVGTAELAGAIGLLTPWLAGLAAAGLAGSDPRLASMLTIFSRLAAGEEMPAREKTRVRRGRPAVHRPRRARRHPRRA